MKIIVVCAGGFSSSIVMNKLVKWGTAHDEEVDCEAISASAIETYPERFDCVLVAPQVSYQINSIQEFTDKPVLAISAMDYAIANADGIMQQVHNAINEKGEE